MTNHAIWPTCVLIWLNLPLAFSNQALSDRREVRQVINQILQQEHSFVYQAPHSWLFLTKELEALALAPQTLAAMPVEKSEPSNAFSVLVDFDQMLKKAGIQLLLVPVPLKATIKSKRWSSIDPAILHAPFAAFYQQLAAEKVHVLDLYSAFMALSAKGQQSYCRQDSHWTPQAAETAAHHIAEWIQGKAPAMSPNWRVSDPQPFQINGDLANMLHRQSVSPESLQARSVRYHHAPFRSDTNASILLMGDSHTLVFSSGLLATQAGLPDHLWASLGQPLDLVGVLGGGVNASRIKLARRRNNLAGKKWVVWCFSARELVVPSQPWQTIPVIRP